MLVQLWHHGPAIGHPLLEQFSVAGPVWGGFTAPGVGGPTALGRSAEAGAIGGCQEAPGWFHTGRPLVL